MSVNKVNSDGSTTLISGSTLWADSPIGSILPYGGANAPSGWMLCQGQAISRTIYSELFAVIGTSFGSGDGSTTFNLPDLREATTKGVGKNPNGASHVKSGGLALGEFIDDRVQEHTHLWGGTENWVGGTTNSMNKEGTQSLAPTSGVRNARIGATTEVKSVGVNYIIKAKMVAMPSDFMSKVDEAVGEYVIYEKYTATVSGGYFMIPKREGYILASVTAEYGNMAPAQIVGIQSTQDSHYNIYVRNSNDTTALISGTNDYHLIWLKNV